jgi:hypothetical protein
VPAARIRLSSSRRCRHIGLPTTCDSGHTARSASSRAAPGEVLGPVRRSPLRVSARRGRRSPRPGYVVLAELTRQPTTADGDGSLNEAALLRDVPAQARRETPRGRPVTCAPSMQPGLSVSAAVATTNGFIGRGFVGFSKAAWCDFGAGANDGRGRRWELVGVPRIRDPLLLRICRSAPRARGALASCR